MTRLPTGMPTRPVFQAGISFPSLNAVGGAVGCDDDGQLSLNTWRVRQIEATYLTTIDWPAFTAGPVPSIRVFTTILDGGALLGITICGAVPAAAWTVGRLPPPLLTCLPLALASAGNACNTSITQTRVSVGLMPICALPWLPYAYFGGSTASTRLPTRWPATAFCRPDSPMDTGKTCGMVLKLEKSSLLVLPRQTYRLKFARKESLFVSFWPCPLTRVLVTSLRSGCRAGMCTLGA